jgi:hypothetical protein
MQRIVEVAYAEASRVRKGTIIAAQNDPKKIIQDIFKTPLINITAPSNVL